MKKFSYLTLSILTLASYLVVPACGNKGNSSSTPSPYPQGYYGAANCVPGQVCNMNIAGGADGIPLLDGPAIAQGFDNSGTALQLFLFSPTATAGQVYSGPANFRGTMIVGPQSVCPPPGQYNVVGQGQVIPGYGGADFGATGNLQLTLMNGNGYPGAYGPVNFQVVLNQSAIHHVGIQQWVMGTQLGFPACPMSGTPTGYRLMSTQYN